MLALLRVEVNLCLSFLSAIYLLLGGNCCLGLQTFWVVSVAAQTNQLFNPLLQSELPSLWGLSRPEFDQSNFADLENLYPNTDFIRNIRQMLLLLCACPMRELGAEEYRGRAHICECLLAVLLCLQFDCISHTQKAKTSSLKSFACTSCHGLVQVFR